MRDGHDVRLTPHGVMEQPQLGRHVLRTAWVARDKQNLQPGWACRGSGGTSGGKARDWVVGNVSRGTCLCLSMQQAYPHTETNPAGLPLHACSPSTSVGTPETGKTWRQIDDIENLITTSMAIFGSTVGKPYSNQGLKT
jgi:hypothetical protein